MTRCGYVLTMRNVRIAELKARLSQYLRGVRRGHTLTVLDRDTPIARIVPYTPEGTSLSIREPRPDSPGLHQVPLPPPLHAETDVVAMLLEERQIAR